jgi:DNA polymerase III delta prime subunit
MKLYEDLRPMTFDEIVGQKEAAEKFKTLLDNALVTDFLFAGPSGCGKTTLAAVAARYKFGDEWTERYHEFNASDDRGLPFVRGQIKDLAAFSYPKIILLDEADSMTPDAYEAMRKIVEGSGSTIFILCVNDLGKVLQAIQSRCKIIKFRPLSNEDVWTVLMNAFSHLGIDADFEDEKVQRMFDNIALLADGDLRIAIQELAAYIRVTDDGYELNLDRPLEDKPNVTYLQMAVQIALEGKLQEAIQRVEDALIVDRVIPHRAIKQAYDYVKQFNDEQVKAEIIHRLAQLDVDLQHSYPLIQYAGFLSYVWLVGSMAQKAVAK